jgi:Flp pilus assembly protein TadD
MDGLPPALTAALQAHQAGQVAQAESLYRQFLQTAPQLAEGHHLLGVLLHQMRRHGEAATIS